MTPARRRGTERSVERLRRRRQASQLLHRPRRQGAAALVRHLLGVQAQIPTAAGLALRARTEGLTAARVERARLRDRSIVLTWAMRGTLHLVAADDVGWLVGLTVEPHVANSRRRLREMGVGKDQADRAVRAIERMVERVGPMTRAEIGERLRRGSLPTEGQILPHLIWLASAGGRVCIGPEQGGQRTYVLVRDWLGKPAPLPPDRALAELTVRYLRAHGPATPGDLVAWSGIRAGDANRGWRSIEDRLVEVEGSSMWALKSRPLEEVPAGLVRLLPSFDEYLLGWKDRRFLADAATWRRIMPGGGWFHPAVVAGGRPVGAWALDRRTADARVDIRAFSHPTPAIRRGITAEVEALASYLRTGVQASFARS